MEPYTPADITAGWPRRSLLWAVPAALALGFVAGVAIAVYSPARSPRTLPSPASAAAAAVGAPTGQGEPAPLSPDAPSAGTLTPVPQSIPVPPAEGSRLPAPVADARPDSAPVTPSAPPRTPAPATMNDARDARLALAREFNHYAGAAAQISQIDHQQMRNAGMSASLVGILSVEAYQGWQRAAHDEPHRLQAWLESAARKVLPAISQERFFLAWAVVDVRSDRPPGFSESEVTALANGRFLVVRPLASTIDPGEATVSLRTPPSPSGGAAVSGAGPWATYGPVLRFDATDLYRPLGTAGTKPKE